MRREYTYKYLSAQHSEETISYYQAQQMNASIRANSKEFMKTVEIEELFPTIRLL